VDEAFRVGFALRCADEGLSGTEMGARVEKAAALLEKRADLWDKGKDVLRSTGQLGGLALGAGLVVPMGLGAGAGYLLHKATEQDIDEEDVQKREMIDELRHWARRAREHRKARATLPAAP
jgi:hypothetical protein